MPPMHVLQRVALLLMVVFVLVQLVVALTR
jgi:hypothetical protein